MNLVFEWSDFGSLLYCIYFRRKIVINGTVAVINVASASWSPSTPGRWGFTSRRITTWLMKSKYTRAGSERRNDSAEMIRGSTKKRVEIMKIDHFGALVFLVSTPNQYKFCKSFSLFCTIVFFLCHFCTIPEKVGHPWSRLALILFVRCGPSVVSTILFSILFVSYSYCGVCTNKKELSIFVSFQISISLLSK